MRSLSPRVDFHFVSNLRHSRFAASASSESHFVVGFDVRRAHRLSGDTLSSSSVMTLTIWSVNASMVMAGDQKSNECLRTVSNDVGTIFLIFRNIDVMTRVVGTLKARFACTSRWSEMQPASSISTSDSDSAVSVAKIISLECRKLFRLAKSIYVFMPPACLKTVAAMLPTFLSNVYATADLSNLYVLKRHSTDFLFCTEY